MFATVLRMLCVGSLLGLAQAASWAQVTLTIQPTPLSRASYSEVNQPSYIRYVVTLRNTSKTLAASVANVQLTLIPTSTTTYPDFFLIESPVVASCSTSASKVNITCQFQQNSLRPGASLVSNIYLRVPAKTAIGVPDNGTCRGTDCLSTQAVASYVQNNQSLKTTLVTASKVGIGSLRNAAVYSASPKGAPSRTYSTLRSPTSTASSSDPWGVTVSTTSDASSTTISIQESYVATGSKWRDGTTCTNFAQKCIEAQITVAPPLVSPAFLTFTFVSSAINNLPTTFNNAQIRYFQLTTSAPYTPPSCGLSQVPIDPNFPCLLSKTQLANGDIEWKLISYKNGGWRFF